MRIGGNILQVIAEFLSDRSECVFVDGQMSEKLRVLSGITQGGVF